MALFSEYRPEEHGERETAIVVRAAITEHRIAWVTTRATEIHYFVNARNAPSIDLHARLGFRELTRDLRSPG